MENMDKRPESKSCPVLKLPETLKSVPEQAKTSEATPVVHKAEKQTNAPKENKFKTFFQMIDFKKIFERLTKNFGRKFSGFLVLIGVLIVWELASKAINKELFLPSPASTWEAIKTLYFTDSLFKHLGATFGRVTLAILITAVISLPLGMAIVWCKPVNIICEPIVRSLRYVPSNVFNPLLVLFLGIDETMKITFLVIVTLFAYLPSVIQTCTEASEKIKETAYTMGFNYFRTIIYVLFPYLLPSLVQALISTYAFGWNGVILAEVNNTKYGLAHLIYIGSARGRMATVIASVVIIVVLSFVVDKLAKFVVKKIFKWRYLKDE